MHEKNKSIWPLVLLMLSVGLIVSGGFMIYKMTFTQTDAAHADIPEDQAKVIKLTYATSAANKYLDKEIKIVKDKSIHESCQMIVEAMVRQPMVKKKYPWWPQALTVRTAYKLPSGILILDFEKQVKYNHTVGIFEELLLIRSVVNTMIENIDGVKKVKFLVGGQEAETLIGHINISRPLALEDL